MSTSGFNFGPLPRPQRKERRAKTDRGLAPENELSRLASEYLNVQRKLWPDLSKEGLIPVANESVVAEMVDDFKRRHRTGEIDPNCVQVFIRQDMKLAGNYDRYSCDNSSPNSIIDQMVNALRKAKDEGRFVPWQFVFADYSQSGLNAARQGYTSYKKVLANDALPIETTYVDDFTRASRDEIEWWRLAAFSKRLGKRMIGASDGFDLNAPNWDIQISLSSLISRLTIKGLREKVRRGMRGAAGRGTCIGMLSLGFTRRIDCDEHGHARVGPDGLPLHVPCIDPVSAEHRKLLFELHSQKKWSIHRIMKHCNAIKLDGSDGWTNHGIQKPLWSPTAIGVFIWNRTRREYDYDEEKWKMVKNPRDQWVVYYDRNLALVPMEWWRTSRKMIAQSRMENPRTGKPLSRNQKSATTLFSGTLFCRDCKKEIILHRSTEKYKVMACPTGIRGSCNCTLSASKSTRIIESSLLRYLRDQLLTEDVLGSLVTKANDFLKEEAKRPRANTAPLKAQIHEREKGIKRLFERLEKVETVDLCTAFEKRIEHQQKELIDLKNQLRQIEIKDAPTPPPLATFRSHKWF
jgi:hypothetical protein